jgi:hypothetical protein
MSCTKKNSLGTKLYEIVRCPDSFYDANPPYVVRWYKCLCRLRGVRLDKWMQNASAMNVGLQPSVRQTSGGQTHIADWYLSCLTTECCERTDCLTIGVPARVKIPKPDILCQRSWFPSFHYQETGRLLSLYQIGQNPRNSQLYKAQIQGDQKFSMHLVITA